MARSPGVTVTLLGTCMIGGGSVKKENKNTQRHYFQDQYTRKEKEEHHLTICSHLKMLVDSTILRIECFIEQDPRQVGLVIQHDADAAIEIKTMAAMKTGLLWTCSH